jgi:hypothetical protein
MLQNYSKGMMIGLAVAFMILPIVFIGLRLWAKLLSAKKTGWDDYLAGFATVSDQEWIDAGKILTCSRFCLSLAVVSN